MGQLVSVDAVAVAMQAATHYWYRAVNAVTATGHSIAAGVTAVWVWLCAAWQSIAAQCAGGWRWTRNQAVRASGSMASVGHAVKRTVTRSN